MSGYHHLHVIVCHIDEDSVRRKTGVTLASALRLSDWEVVRRPCVKSMSAISNCLMLELMMVRKTRARQKYLIMFEEPVHLWYFCLSAQRLQFSLGCSSESNCVETKQ